MNNQEINYLLALCFFIALIIRKIWIINLFTYEEKPRGTIRTCKKCGTRQWKSKIVCKWVYMDHYAAINFKCNCRNHIAS